MGPSFLSLGSDGMSRGQSPRQKLSYCDKQKPPLGYTTNQSTTNNQKIKTTPFSAYGDVLHNRADRD